MTRSSLEPEAASREALPGRCRVPVSTYRLQFHRGFTFREAARVVPYLARLGVTDCYSSPYLKAAPGSTHGYDICDHNRLNPEVGGEADFASFTDALAAHGMGQVLDFVPNHMGAEPDANPWWHDVLENGPSSPYARFFDIDWRPLKPELREKVLIPVLGDQYGVVLEKGELRLNFGGGGFFLTYYDHRFPINPTQLPKILELGIDALRREMTENDPHFQEFLSVLTALKNLPDYTETRPDRIAERQREKEVARTRLALLVEVSPRLRRHIEDNLKTFNGAPGDPRSFDLLHELLEAQVYRLSYWRTAFHEINYRRFFDINTLAGLRMDDEKVFDASHALVLKLVREWKITGLRLDHVDGLFDPAGYFDRLQESVRRARGGRSGSAGRSGEELPFYVAVEKILSPGESLPDGWAVHGTSGYDFLNDVNGLFVYGRNERKMKRLYHRFTGRQAPFSIVAYVGKRLITVVSMAGELNVLAHMLNRISEENRRTRDYTLESLRDALREVVACFPVYRTYLNAAGWAAYDKKAVETAILRARRRNPGMEGSIFDFINRVLFSAAPSVKLEEPPPPNAAGSADEYRRHLYFTMRFQQYTGPVQAKGLEDTAFYRYNVLASLNEVGGHPDRFGHPPVDFHQANLHRMAKRPFGMLATSTHDTKRGEDARLRISALSELADEWRRHVGRWSRINAGHRALVEGDPAPDRNDEYLFYQTLVGVWPAGPEGDGPASPGLRDRLREYMMKAIKEAKLHTSWINPNSAYEEAASRFVEQVLAGPRSARFYSSFLPFQRRVARAAMVHSLSQVALKIASPGVPDFYQGTELWDLSLVDPDNRRPVDYQLRARFMDELEPFLEDDALGRAGKVRELLGKWEDGRIKMYVTAAGLRLRRARPDLFLRGRYVPLSANREKSEHITAFAREHGGDALIAVAPRLVASLAGADFALPLESRLWDRAGLSLPGDLGFHEYVNVLTGETVRPVNDRGELRLPLADALRTCPVALLVSRRSE